MVVRVMGRRLVLCWGCRDVELGLPLHVDCRAGYGHHRRSHDLALAKAHADNGVASPSNAIHDHALSRLCSRIIQHVRQAFLGGSSRDLQERFALFARDCRHAIDSTDKFDRMVAR